LTLVASDLIPVNLITGFLGSGKTTLLQRALRSPELGTTAVLINEFGEVGLDHYLLQRVDEATVLLESGCVCCTIRGDLRDSIRDLYGRRERGLLPPFERLVIETTGLADPAPIVTTLSADPVLCHHFRIGNIVTVVDAMNGLSTLASFEESRRQAAIADRLVISKCDIADAGAIDRLRASLRRLNPAAVQLDAAPDAMSAARLLTAEIDDPLAKSEGARRWLAEEEDLIAGHDHGGDHHHSHSINRHGEDIVAFSVRLDEPLQWSAFAVWLTMLLNRHGRAILRIKGLLHVAGVPTPVVIHGVQHTIHQPTHLPAWPDGAPQTRLIVIAKGVDRAHVETSLAAFNRLATAA
jgi:G3E family GTPase